MGTWLAASNPAYQKVVDFLKVEIHPTSVLVASLPQPAVLSKENSPRAKKGRKKKEVVVEPQRDLAAMDELFADDGDDGTCIRCGIEIEFNIEKPLCRACYEVWKKHKDPEYPEKYCQLCGGKHKTSLSKPLCRDCWEDSRS